MNSYKHRSSIFKGSSFFFYIAFCSIGLFFSCGGVQPSGKIGDAEKTCKYSNNSEPDWIQTGGSTKCYPESEYITGFAVATGENAEDSAKEKAAADLSSRISVRIEHELMDVSSEKDGASSYYVASITRATSDIQLSNLTYEVHRQEGRVYSLAVLKRELQAEQYSHGCEASVMKLRACLKSADRLRRSDDKSPALESYQTCRLHVVEALEQDSITRVLDRARAMDEQEHNELVSASQLIKDRIGEILGRTSTNLQDATDSLALQLVNQGVSTKSRWIFAPLTYGITNFSSPFGQRVALDLESALSRYGTLSKASKSRESADMAARGVFVEEGDILRVTITVKEVKSGRLVASAETSIPKDCLPPDLHIVPKNFEDALLAQRLLAEGELVTGALRVEIWADKGNRGVVYSASEEMKLYIRVNQPAYVRIIYVLENGYQVVVEQSYYLDATKVNMAVEYPYAFEIVPPFGIEHLYATAFTEKPHFLKLETRIIDGVEYEIIADGLQSVVRHRGIQRKKKKNQTSESILSITTLPKSN
ncbi:MAG: DUF4384 domain-containing protein [Deltaproteobacteria bacterium]|nr:DUF4384 domain-containing protein [Deltaproteobacteria bacterium]